MNAQERLRQFKRSLLFEFFGQLEQGQCEKFIRTYGNPIEVPNEKLEESIDLCERIVKKNKKAKT